MEDSLVTVLEETLQYLQAQQRRDVNPVQVKILLNSALNSIADQYNQIFLNMDQDTDVVIQTLMDALQLMNRITNLIPNAPELEKIHLNFTSFANFLRSSIADTNFSSDIISNFSVANILAQILFDEPERITLPQLPSCDHPLEFLDIFTPQINYLESIINLYSVLIRDTPLITSDDITKWADVYINFTRLMVITLSTPNEIYY